MQEEYLEPGVTTTPAPVAPEPPLTDRPGLGVIFACWLMGTPPQLGVGLSHSSLNESLKLSLNIGGGAGLMSFKLSCSPSDELLLQERFRQAIVQRQHLFRCKTAMEFQRLAQDLHLLKNQPLQSLYMHTLIATLGRFGETFREECVLIFAKASVHVRIHRSLQSHREWV
uniref:Uncharacterized protein n=1 Tax=Anopheles merus TaxID=30066 RepID=A0A182UP11_ANOME